jgi:hypothetical protein
MKRHRTDPVSLIFALVFLGIAAWWLIARNFDLTPAAFGWFMAAALILFGVLGLAGALRGSRSAPGGEATPVGPAPAGQSVGEPATSDLAKATATEVTAELSELPTTKLDEPVTGPPVNRTDAER